MQQGKSSAEPGPRGSLTRKQREVMRLLARGISIPDAAREAGVNEERVRRWTKTHRFREALAREVDHPTPNGAASDVLREVSEPKPEIPGSPSARRSTAIDFLASGMSITKAAELSGYSRPHLSHLINHDIQFVAEYRRRLAEDHERRTNGFWTTYDHSKKVIDQLLDEGDPRTAMEVFKLGSRGVTDVEYRFLHPQESEPPKPAPPPSSQEPRSVPPGLESVNLTCDDCGLVAKSRGGLTQHRRAKHAGGHDKK